jgi:hypothetical protein
MIRWMSDFLSAASVLLCIATFGLWLRSYRVADYLPLYSKHRTDGICISRGGISLQIGYCELSLDGRTGHWTRSPADYDAAHFNYASEHEAHVIGPGLGFLPATRTLDCPLWSFVPVFLVLPGLWLLRWSRRPISGLCRTCLYDLTGNTSDVCPECGTPIPSKLEAIA